MWYKVSKIILTLVLVVWGLSIIQTIPIKLKDSIGYIRAFVNIDGELVKAYNTPQEKMDENLYRYKAIIDEEYLKILKESYPRNYDQIIREIVHLDFKHPITKGAYFINAQNPPEGSTILMFSPVNWMSHWPISKFFQYKWVNIASEANPDASPKEQIIYTEDNFNKISEAVAQYNPEYILAVFVFTKVFDISGYSPIYVGDAQFGGAVVYKKV